MQRQNRVAAGILPSPTLLIEHRPADQGIYAALALRMSESPASRMAMVEQRKSLPQAVPSSIYNKKVQGQSFGDSLQSVLHEDSFFSGL